MLKSPPQPRTLRPPTAATERWLTWDRLSAVSFGLSLAIVIARMLMLESLRGSVDPLPGVEATPAGPGPGAGLTLDLLAMLPALVVLARRVGDSRFILRVSWGSILLILLGIWAVASTLWAPDKFAAIVSSVHLLAAAVFVWSSFQLTRRWLDLRRVAGVCAGLLICLTLAGYEFRLVEWRDMKIAWEEQRSQVLKEHHWAAGSFDARQFEKRILSGEVMGFSASPNTYAALLDLLGFVTVGMAIQKLLDREAVGWAIIPIIVVAAATRCLYWAESRGAIGTAVLGAAILGVLAAVSPLGARQRRTLFWLSVLGTLLVGGAVVQRGVTHGTLFHDSLTFRWRYWVGAARMIREYPWLGVGWSNFGNRYLAFRLPIASEEISDPHCFVVRIVAELGIVGGVLLAGVLLRLGWELTLSSGPVQQVISEPPQRVRARGLLWSIVAIVFFGLAANYLAAVDLNAVAGYLLLELVRRVFFAAALAAGLVIGGLRFWTDSLTRGAKKKIEAAWDQRPAPVLLLALLVGVGMFLVHNLIDFAMFENGPMFLLALLLGAALGMSQPVPAPSVGAEPRRRPLAVGGLVVAAAAWLTLAIAVTAPVVSAESLARDADDSIRAARPDLAAAALESAFHEVPYNGDYAYRAAIARAQTGRIAAAAELVEAAIRVTPTSAGYLAARADWVADQPVPKFEQARGDYERAVRLDPQSVSLHLRFAKLLLRMRDASAASRELDTAVAKNDQMDAHDPKRLKPEQFADLSQQIDRSIKSAR